MPADASQAASLKDFYEERYKAGYMSTSQAFVDFRAKAMLSIVPRDVRTILDYGCGQGSKTGVLEEVFPDSEITGIDISEDAVKKAAGRFPRHRFIAFDGASAPFPDEGFDLVFSWHVLEHVWDLDVTVKDMSRLVRKGGHLCVALPCGNLGSTEERIVRLVGGEERSKTGEVRWIYEDEGHLRRATSERLIKAFEQCGMALAEESYTGQSWGGVLNVLSFAPTTVSKMLPVGGGRTAAEKAKVAALRAVLVPCSFLVYACSATPLSKVFYGLSVKEWEKHHRESSGSEQALVFKRADRR